MERSSPMSLKTLIGFLRLSALSLAALVVALGAARAEPYLVVDVDSGQAMIENQATQPWFPASVTKLMTTYVALSAVRDGRLTMDTPLTMSMRAARSQPSKMGFRPGTLVTLDNALKMLMVKSPNDIAVMVAEGISGSVESFADEMNAAGAKLGLKESHFVNPNGLHDPRHYSSARDMAIIARALIKEFPEHADLFDIGAIQLGAQIIPNHNGLLGRYPGADGMKTGFTCAAGFNVVASATRNGRRLIVVVFGSPSARERNIEAAQLFDRGFAQASGGPTLASLDALPNAEPPDMHGPVCSRRGHSQMTAMEEDFGAPVPAAVAVTAGRNGSASAAPPGPPTPAATVLLGERVYFEPIPVFVGAREGWTGPVLAARSDAPEPTLAKTAPEASAFIGEKTSEGQAPSELAAPVALQGAVHTPPPPARADSRVRRRFAAARPRPMAPPPPRKPAVKRKAP
jgi:D-alanyl-D-alanine carboxypeptidase